MFCFVARTIKPFCLAKFEQWLNNTLVTGQKFFNVILLATKKSQQHGVYFCPNNLC